MVGILGSASWFYDFSLLQIASVPFEIQIRIDPQNIFGQIFSSTFVDHFFLLLARADEKTCFFMKVTSGGVKESQSRLVGIAHIPLDLLKVSESLSGV